MKRLIQIISITVIPIIFALIFFVLVGFIQPNTKIKYNGETILLDDTKPLYYDDARISAILVPIDILARKMGDKLDINFDDKTLTIKSEKYILKLKNNSKEVYVNDVLKMAPVEITFEKNHVYGPLRFLCDSLGRNVYWDSSASTINIFDSHSKDIFNYIYASDFVSNDKFKMNPNKLFFYKDGAASFRYKPDYLPEQKINPNINAQLYNITNVIVDPSYYTDIEYLSSHEITDSSLPNAHISVNSRKDESILKNYFNFSFYDTKAINMQEAFSRKDLSSKAVVKLEINTLQLSGNSDNPESKNILKERLKLALTAMFKESTGLNISEFIEYEYKKLMETSGASYTSYVKSRRFDNVNVNLMYNYPGLPENTLEIYFSIK